MSGGCHRPAVDNGKSGLRRHASQSKHVELAPVSISPKPTKCEGGFSTIRLKNFARDDGGLNETRTRGPICFSNFPGGKETDRPRLFFRVPSMRVLRVGQERYPDRQVWNTGASASSGSFTERTRNGPAPNSPAPIAMPSSQVSNAPCRVLPFTSRNLPGNSLASSFS